MRKIKAGKLGVPHGKLKETIFVPIVLILVKTVKLWRVLKMTCLGIIGNGILI